MYAKDLTSTYAGVRIIDIYHMHTLMSASTASHECSAKDAATVKSWHNKMFYLIDVGVPGMPALYTSASQARSIDSTVSDTTKPLVPVIPDLVPILLSTRSLTLAPLDDTAPKWSRNSLREDILWIAHYVPPHSSRHQDRHCRQHHAPSLVACSRGLPVLYSATSTVQSALRTSIDVERNVGIGIKSSSRFTWLVIDDKILPSSIAEHTTYVSVLSMVDPASGSSHHVQAPKNHGCS